MQNLFLRPPPAVVRVRQRLEALRDPKWETACTAITTQRALALAERAAQHRFQSPLSGRLVVWKDIFDQRGEVTTLGSALRRSAQPADRNATTVDQIEAAGAVSLARTGLSEFAFSGLGINPHFGTPPSALSTTKPLVPGGSTSGSAVLVAAGLADLGMGTDTSGSVRIPAALNGIFGFRPSTARYERKGVHVLSPTLDTVGTLARSLDVILDADRVLAPDQAMAAPPPTCEILDLSQTLGVDWDPQVAQAYHDALSWAAKAGWRVRSGSISAVQELRRLVQDFGPLVAIEARHRYADLLASHDANKVDPMIRARLARAPVLSDQQYQTYLRQRAQLVAQAQQEIGNRLVAFPTVPALRHPLGTYQNDPAAAQALNARLLAATMVGSLLDLPGVAMPLRRADGFVRGSILVSAAQGNDAFLLAQAKALAPKITHLTPENYGE